MSLTNSVENVEANCLCFIHTLEPIMNISHVCEVCDTTYKGGVGVGTLVCPSCVREALLAMSEEDELNEVERVFGSCQDESDPSLDDSLFGP